MSERARLLVKVTPKSSTDALIGWRGEELRVKVTASPERNAANLAVLKLLSKTFDIPQREITLLQGATSRIKLYELAGITPENLKKIIERVC